MNKLQEFKEQLNEIDRKIAEYEELREDICFRIDNEEYLQEALSNQM